MLDYTTDPPRLHITAYTKNRELQLLKPLNPFQDGDMEDGYIYEIPALQEMTGYLMHLLDMHYDRHYDPKTVRRRLKDFSAAERRLYMPFAFMLACVSGNAMRTGQLNPFFDDPHAPLSPETISSYIPDAYHIMMLNSATPAEIIDLIQVAAT